jgi:glycosyltransferase involved in cell wall biosynthesis
MRKVSVIVPVYNPGRFLDDLLASLARQTMPAADFEVLFVDDGSTDGTHHRLDRIATSSTNVRVIHIPNSGWPGRPRNVGIDAAEGQYVQFVDDDDELGDEALQRMYDYAVANSSDVVVGREGRRQKVWGAGPLFAADRPNATLADDPALLLLLTPHKMFRRAFLREQGIRFLEGPRYLEDHAFVMTAYFRAEVISVLATYTCYLWHRRPGSAGRRPKEWARYFDSMRDVLDVVEAHTEPGELRDRLMSHWYRTKGLRRLGPRFVDLPDDEARVFFQELRDLTLERFPTRLDGRRQLGSMRLRAALLRAGAYEKTRELAGVERTMYITEHVDDLRVSPDRLELTVTATLRLGDGSALRLDQTGGKLVLEPPVSLDGIDLPRSALGVALRNERMTLTVYARHRSTDQRFALPGRTTILAVRTDGRLQVSVTAHVCVDPSAVEEGRPMRPGRWWLEAELGFAGWVARSPIRSRRISARFDLADVSISGDSRPTAVAPLVRTAAFLRCARAGRGR